jgi:NADPH:quinone reductase-like Zn-dependent oxidoreductase
MSLSFLSIPADLRHIGRFENMNRLITARQIRPVVDKVFDFTDAQEAYKYLESQKHVGKVVIKVSA